MVNGSARDKPRSPQSSSPLQNQTLFAIMRVEPESRQASGKTRSPALVRFRQSCRNTSSLFGRVIAGIGENANSRNQRSTSRGRLFAHVCAARCIRHPNHSEARRKAIPSARPASRHSSQNASSGAVRLRRMPAHTRARYRRPAAKKMPHRMPASIVERIPRIERQADERHRNPRCAVSPRSYPRVSFESERWIAEAKVHLSGQRLIGIEIIAAPTPTGAPHHHGQMIRALRFSSHTL